MGEWRGGSREASGGVVKQVKMLEGCRGIVEASGGMGGLVEVWACAEGAETTRGRLRRYGIIDDAGK